MFRNSGRGACQRDIASRDRPYTTSPGSISFLGYAALVYDQQTSAVPSFARIIALQITREIECDIDEVIREYRVIADNWRFVRARARVPAYPPPAQRSSLNLVKFHGGFAGVVTFARSRLTRQPRYSDFDIGVVFKS